MKHNVDEERDEECRLDEIIQSERIAKVEGEYSCLASAGVD